MNWGMLARRTRPLPLGMLATALATASLIALAGTGILDGWLVASIVMMLIMPVTTIVLALRFAVGPLARFVARRPYSIRWKVWTAIGATTALFVAVGINNILAMDYMHAQVHEIRDLARLQPFRAASALDELDRTQHGPLFSLTPLLMFIAALSALTLGTAIAWSVIEPVRRMGQAMRRIAAGDFSEPLAVRNRDEVGELAERINDAARDLARLQEATLAEERARALRERIAQVTLAQEEERRRISRELHDDLGPSLAAIGNRVRAARAVVRADPDRAERDLQAIADGLKGHIREIRKLIYDLRPLTLDQLGLTGAIRQHAARWSQETGIPVSLQMDGDAASNPLAEVTVFRVLQECLSNIGKHAAAASVEVRLERAPGVTRLIVADDGRGFDGTAPDMGARGLGLVSMRERAEIAGGSVSVESAPRGGCRVILEIPTGEVVDGTDPRPAGG